MLLLPMSMVFIHSLSPNRCTYLIFLVSFQKKLEIYSIYRSVENVYNIVLYYAFPLKIKLMIKYICWQFSMSVHSFLMAAYFIGQMYPYFSNLFP